jgi:hypothetical protein
MTPQLSTVNREKSILPTGSLKLENGVLYQEASVFVHVATQTEPVGLTREWFPVKGSLVEQIRSS